MPQSPLHQAPWEALARASKSPLFPQNYGGPLRPSPSPHWPEEGMPSHSRNPFGMFISSSDAFEHFLVMKFRYACCPECRSTRVSNWADGIMHSSESVRKDPINRKDSGHLKRFLDTISAYTMVSKTSKHKLQLNWFRVRHCDTCDFISGISRGSLECLVYVLVPQFQKVGGICRTLHDSTVIFHSQLESFQPILDLWPSTVGKY